MPDAYTALCRQTVTLYHADAAAETVTRTVLHGCCLDSRRRVTQSGQGSSAAGAFLLIIPAAAGQYGSDYTLAPQDKVLPGEGAKISYQDWAEFTPIGSPGLCAVQYVDPKYRGGVFHHLEAGGWWTKGGSGAHSLTD